MDYFSVFSLTELDRTIYTAIYEQLLEDGYTPEINDTTTQETHKAALSAIVQDKGFAIDIYGNTTNEELGELIVCQVTISRVSVSKSKNSGSSTPIYRRISNNQVTQINLPNARDISYNITFAFADINAERYFTQVLMDLFDYTQHNPVIDLNYGRDINRDFITHFSDMGNVSVPEVGLALYEISIKDTMVGTIKQTGLTIDSINQIDINYEVNYYNLFNTLITD